MPVWLVLSWYTNRPGQYALLDKKFLPLGRPSFISLLSELFFEYDNSRKSGIYIADGVS